MTGGAIITMFTTVQVTPLGQPTRVADGIRGGPLILVEDEIHGVRPIRAVHAIREVRPIREVRLTRVAE